MTNPAAVTRFGFHSLKRRCNLTPVRNVCKATVRSFFWTLRDSTNYRKCVFWTSFQYDWWIGNGFFNRPIMARTKILVRAAQNASWRFLPGFGYVTSATQATFSLQGHYSGQLFITAKLSLPRQAGKLQLPINTEFHLEVQKLVNMRTYERNLEQK